MTLVETRFRVLDCARPVTDEALAKMVQAGVDGVGRYLTGPQAIYDWKRVTADEIARIHAARLMLYLFFQNDNDYLDYFTYSRGLRDGGQGCELADELGAPEWLPVPGTVDFGASHEECHTVVVHYFNGFFDALREHATKHRHAVRTLAAYGGYELVRCAMRHWTAVPVLWQAAAWGPRAPWGPNGAPIELPGVHAFQHDTGAFAGPDPIDAYGHEVDINVAYFKGWLPGDGGAIQPHGHRGVVVVS